MVENMVQGGGAVPETPVKGKRFLAALVDLVLIPIIIGVVAGLLLIAAPAVVRNTVLIVLNILWMTFKDVLADGKIAFGKRMAGIKVVTADTGGKISVAQGFIRNILLIIPIVLVLGYILEIILLAATGKRLGDKWANTKVVLA